MIADHATDPRGVPVTFMGLPTTAQRVVALLAVHYKAEIVVGGMRRTGRPFHVDWLSIDVIRPADWVAAVLAISWRATATALAASTQPRTSSPIAAVDGCASLLMVPVDRLASCGRLADLATIRGLPRILSGRSTSVGQLSTGEDKKCCWKS